MLKKLDPPKLAQWLLRCSTKSEEKFAILGDYTEEYLLIAHDEGIRRAKAWYWKQTLYSVLPNFMNKFNWNFAMFINLLKMSYRNLRKHKAYSLINILGLALGMACCIFIMLWVHDELSWDRFHENASRLYRVIEEVDNPGGIEYRIRTPIALAPALVSEIPEITQSTRSVLLSLMLEHGEKRFANDAIDFVDPSFFRMFSFPLIQGDPDLVLNDKYSIVITEKMKEKYFGHQDPLGRSMRLAGQLDLIVTGVMADPPRNTHWHFDCLVPNDLWGELGVEMNSWEDFYTYTSVMLREKASVQAVNEKIRGMILKHRPDSKITLFLQPFRKIHLYALEGGGNIRTIYIFSVVAIMILVIACINFMNLTTARSSTRAKEVGMRKVIGAFRIDLIKQFFGESIFLTVISLFLSVVLVTLFLPAFNNLTEKQLAFRITENTTLVLGLCGIALFTGLLSGSYPSLYLSAFRPIRILRGTSRTGARSLLLRRILVIMQFMISTSFIIGAVIITRQLRFMRHRDLGFDVQNLVDIGMDTHMRSQYEKLREELLMHPNIISMGRTSSLPGYINPGTADVTWEGKASDHEVVMHDFPVGYEFIETMKMRIIQGRSFDKNMASEPSAYILNETAVRVMDLGGGSPIRRKFSFSGRQGTIVGVVKDFHHGSLHASIEPLVLSYTDGFMVCLRMKPEHVSETVDFLETKWHSFGYDYPFEIEFLKDRFDEYYQKEERLSALINYSTFLAIFISCLGLFGMVSFTVEQRTKEIGIRKVLGASVAHIFRILFVEYFRWIFLANIIAWPVAWWVMNRWLVSFAYRIRIDLTIFLISGIIAFIVALMTVSFQVMKAATANPVEALKYE